MAILVCGGAGYIGSHTCVELLAAGYDIVVADNFYNSCPKAVERIKQISGKDFRFVEVDLTDAQAVEALFAQNPDIEQGMLHFVRQLQPGPTGIPLEIYCFSARQSFVEYERVQADLFDHLFAVLPLFNLRIFQYPSDSLRVETFKS